MKIQIKNLAEQLFSRNESRISIPDEIIEILKKDGMSELEALVQSDQFIKKIKTAIDKKIKDCKNQGIVSKYSFDSSNSDILILTHLAVEVNQEKDIKNIIEWKDQINEFLRIISWQDFEKVCKLVLEINGVNDCHVTRDSKEGGIDAFGWLRFPGSRRIFHEINMRVICQGKHRSKEGPVDNGETSEFVTDIDKLRKKLGFSLFVIPEDFMGSPTPLIPILITNSYFGGDAVSTAKEYGIILWNGEQISEDIVRYFDLSEFISNGKIDIEKFRTYLNQPLLP
jgi:hypothetical protein